MDDAAKGVKRARSISPEGTDLHEHKKRQINSNNTINTFESLGPLDNAKLTNDETAKLRNCETACNWRLGRFKRASAYRFPATVEDGSS